MHKEIIFSLIMATYGRKGEIALFLDSLLIQKFPMEKVEVIIVDQNDEIDLADIFNKYSKLLNLIYIKSERKGLSLNRNLGLKKAAGKYIAFPDDDCTYYSDTLSNVYTLFRKYHDVDVLLGRIIDREHNKNIIRNWSSNEFKITRNNFFLNYSSITIFTKKNNLLFDEKLGVGTYFGSNEDADYVFNILKNNKKIYYTPKIEVWHPEPKEQKVNYNKIYSYGLGFGALVIKHFSFSMLFLFIQAIGYHSIKLLYSLLKLNKIEMKKSWISILSRFKGAYKYAVK